jgi:hypothetical protein
LLLEIVEQNLPAMPWTSLKEVFDDEMMCDISRLFISGGRGMGNHLYL